MKLNDLFTRKVVTAGPEDSLASVARKMKEHNIGSVVITEWERPVGILTDRDIALALGADGRSRQSPAREVMTPHVVAVPEDTGIFTATKYIRECGVRRLPVVDREDHVVGLVSVDDLLLCLATELSNLTDGIEHETVTR